MDDLQQLRHRLSGALDFAFFLVLVLLLCGGSLAFVAFVKSSVLEALLILAAAPPLLLWLVLLPRLRDWLDRQKPKDKWSRHDRELLRIEDDEQGRRAA